MSPVLDTGEMPPYFGRMMHDQTIDIQTVHDRAELRSAALLEPFESSLTHVLSLAREAPVIQEPSPSQSLLEGLVVGHLGYLFDPERKRRTGENMVPLGVKAEAVHYTLSARGDHLVAALHRLTPRWEAGGMGVDNGVSGIRWFGSKWGTGVTFYLPGQPGRFTIEGVSAAKFKQYRRTALVAAGEESVRGDDALAHQEAMSPVLSPDSWRIASVISRRLGLLLVEGVTAIDSWWNTSHRFAVELVVREDAPNPMPRILSRMLSQHLAPQLHLERTMGEHHYLSIEGSAAEIDLRILWVPAS